jgi:hypothetical protein
MIGRTTPGTQKERHLRGLNVALLARLVQYLVTAAHILLLIPK